MKWGSSDILNCGNFAYGETEDYCVNIMDNPTGTVVQPMTELSVYPNPTNNLLNISYRSGDDVAYTIYDLTGRNLLSGLIKNGFEQVDISLFNQGMYILKLGGNNGQLKLIKN
jgi:hypothetical protein